MQHLGGEQDENKPACNEKESTTSAPSYAPVEQTQIASDAASTSHCNPLEPAEELIEYYSSGERKRMRAACESCHERKLRCIMLRCGSCQQCYNRKRTCTPRVKRGRTPCKSSGHLPYGMTGGHVMAMGANPAMMSMPEFARGDRMAGMPIPCAQPTTTHAMMLPERRDASMGGHMVLPPDMMISQQTQEHVLPLYQPNHLLLNQGQSQSAPMAMVAMPSGQSMYVPMHSVGTMLPGSTMVGAPPQMSHMAAGPLPGQVPGCMPMSMSARMAGPPAAMGGYLPHAAMARSHKSF